MPISGYGREVNMNAVLANNDRQKFMEVPPAQFSFNYLGEKWSNIKGLSARDMAGKWISDESLVVTLSDSKFIDEPLVIMRQSKLEELTKALDAFATGDLVLKQSLSAVIDQISLISELVEQEPTIIQRPIGKAIRVLTRIQGLVETVVIAGGTSESLKPHRPDQDLLNKLAEDEDDDDEKESEV